MMCLLYRDTLNQLWKPMGIFLKNVLSEECAWVSTGQAPDALPEGSAVQPHWWKTNVAKAVWDYTPWQLLKNSDIDYILTLYFSDIWAKATVTHML